MGIKGCWTCRERRVRCDSQKPKCGNCTKARRVCQGYGIQLSWPRDGDRKRARISRETRDSLIALQSSNKMFLNSSSWDVLLSEELEQNGRVSARYLRTMNVPRPTYLSPAVINREESHLLGFFNESRSLILGPTDEEVLSQFILRIAFSNPSDATNPVLQGVFALASQQLHGSLKSFRYKYLVTSSIKESINWLDEKTLLQNLMATMLLYHYELSLESNSKGSWVIYLCAVKNIINTSPAMRKLVRQEYSVFLDWIYYHEALAEFTVRHWKVPYEGCGYAPTARSPRVIEGGSGSTVEDNIGCPADVLQLVVETCRRAIVTPPSAKNDVNAGIDRTRVLEQSVSRAVGDTGPIHANSIDPDTVAETCERAILAPPSSKYDVNAEIEHSKVLEQTITQAVGSSGPLHIQSSTTPIDRNKMVCDLHRLASLIYVNRAVHCVSGTEFRHRRLVREGILLLTRMKTCQNAWPLFIIACEAVDDEQRLAILEVFEQSRLDRRRRSSHVHFIRYLVEAVWRQWDLDEERQVGFMTIFDTVVGAVPFVPPFA